MKVEASSETCHASCLVLDEDGVLIRGAPGSGKSSVCLALIDEANRDGRFAALIGDDRVRLERHHGRLVAHPHPAIEGLIEVRGAGLVRILTLDAAVIRLVVDLCEALPRYPQEDVVTTTILDVAVPVLHLEARQPRQYLIRSRLAALRRQSAGQPCGTGPVIAVSSQTHSPAVDALRP